VWTREQRLAAFKDSQLLREDDKLYLAVTADFGRLPNEPAEPPAKNARSLANVTRFSK
jgi:hypothetical protein